MAQLVSPETFTDSGANAAVNAARLNNALGGLTALAGLITDQTSATIVSGDSILFYDASGEVLAQTTWAALAAAVIPTDPAVGTAGLRTLGTGALQAAVGATTSANVTGLRKGAGNGSTDTAAEEADLPCAINPAGNAGSIDLNCLDRLKHTVTLTGTAVLTLTNTLDGQVIKVKTIQGAANYQITWAASGCTVVAEGGSAVPSAANGAVDIWTIERWGTVLHVSVRKAFA